MTDTAQVAHEQLAHIWALSGMPADALDRAKLNITAPTMPSSYHVAGAATATIAAAGLAAAELWRLRSGGKRRS